MLDTVVTIGGLAALVMAGIVGLTRLLGKDPTYMFPTWVYTITIPVLNLLLIPVGALLELEGIAMPTDWPSWGKSIVVVLLASLISVIGYTAGSYGLSSYARNRRLSIEAKK